MSAGHTPGEPDIPGVPGTQVTRGIPPTEETEGARDDLWALLWDRVRTASPRSVMGRCSSCSRWPDSASGSGGIGYLLKDRVFDSAQFVDAVRRVAAGGTAMDPEVIARLLARNTGDGSLATLSPREREVLALMAEGRSNAAIAQRMVITERAVAKHTASIFLKLDLQPSDDDNRWVLAVLAYLGG